MPGANTMIIPLGDRIIVRLTSTVSQAESAVADPTPLADEPARGMVIAAGTDRPDSQSVAASIAAGDTVLFWKHLGQKMTLGDLACWIINANAIVQVETRARTPLLRSKSLPRLPESSRPPEP